MFLFPLVNIPSGELKPRSFYVDENAILINSVKFVGDSIESRHERLSPIVETYHTHVIPRRPTEVDLCAMFSASSVLGVIDAKCALVSTHDSVGVSITQLSLQSTRMLPDAFAYEASDIVIAYSSCNELQAIRTAFDISFAVTSHKKTY